jgi:SET domain-containing protein
MKTYRPLPTTLTIKPSNIEGLGLFAEEEIESGIVLGISHIEDDRFENGFIRTPLGGFINHNIESNCRIDYEDDIGRIITKRNIKEGEEISLTYNLYSVDYE